MLQNIHGLLKQQIHHYLGNIKALPSAWVKFVASVNDAYQAYQTERHILCRDLEQLHDDMRAVFEALPDFFFRIDKHGNIINYRIGKDANPAWAKSRIIGNSIFDVLEINEKFLVQKTLRQVLRKNSKSSTEYTATINGKKYYYEARFVPLAGQQLTVVIQDISNRKRAELSVRESEMRLARLNQVLMELTKDKTLTEKSLDLALQKVTEAAAYALNVARVTVWKYYEDEGYAECLDVFNVEKRKHKSGARLNVKDFPRYYEEMVNNRAIAAHDTQRDSRTQELFSNQLIPTNISSMLDAPIRLGGKVCGAICHSHIGDPRKWTLEEQNFSVSMADFIGIIIEAHERQRTQLALRESQEKFRILADTTDSPIFVFRDRILYSNPAMQRLTGYNDIELSHMRLDEIVHPDFKSQAEQMVEACRSNMQTPMRTEIRILTKKAGTRWLYMNTGFINFSGELAGLASAFDITERKQAEEQLRHKALHDELTGLPNRALFADRLEHVFARAIRKTDYHFTVIFLDLDRFKILNDSLGHASGDRFLVEISDRLRACLRPSDTIARLGGDEFAILLEEVGDVNGALHVAERIQTALSLPLNLNGHEMFTTASIGIVINDDSYNHPENMLRDAEIAMYRAKANGKARQEVFNTTMHAQAMRLLELESDLRKAIENNEFELHYQPIVTLDMQRITGFEALVRWRHPERGLVPPMEFIPLAEETGMIIDIGNWVLREACEQLRRWNNEFPTFPNITISVNVSAKQLGRPGLIEHIRGLITETGIDPSCLKVELTESMIMENPESAIAILMELKKLNIQIYVDDFGTGYSSLSYLHRFPIDTLKVDRSFVNNIGENGENSEIVSTVALLAHNMKMNVIAEGVETAAQLRFLNQIGCDLAQGFYFSKPVPAEQATQLISLNHMGPWPTEKSENISKLRH